MFSVTFGLRIGRLTSHDLMSCPAQPLTIPSVATATERGDPAGAGEPGEGVGEVMTVRNYTGHHHKSPQSLAWRSINLRVGRFLGCCSPAWRFDVRIRTQAAISGQVVTGNRTFVPRRPRTQNISRRWLLGSSIRNLDPADRGVICASADFTAYRGFEASPPARHGVQATHQSDVWVGGGSFVLWSILGLRHSAHHTRRARYSAAQGVAAGISSRTRS